MSKITKVTSEQLKQIISEETVRYKKLLELQRKKESIVSQLKELDGDASKNSNEPHAVEGPTTETKPESQPQKQSKKVR